MSSILFWLAGLPAASACGGFFCDTTTTTRIDQAGEHILFIIDDAADQVEMHVEVDYVGSVDDFAWIVPTPQVPDVFLSTEAVFDVLRASTAPTFTQSTSREGSCYRAPRLGCGGTPEGDPSDSDSELNGGGGVRVAAVKRVGPYDTVTLQADNAETLVTWLREQGYDLPEALDSAVAPYVASDSWFVAVKMANDAEAGTLEPIGLRFAGTTPSIPIRLTSVAAMPDMPIVVWVLGSGVAAPANYQQVAYNPLALNWTGGVDAYNALVTAAVDAAGGHGFVLEGAVRAAQALALPLYDVTTVERAIAGLAQADDVLAFHEALVTASITLVPEKLLVSDTGTWQDNDTTEVTLDPADVAAQRAKLATALAACVSLPSDGPTAEAFWACPSCDEEVLATLTFDPEACAEQIYEALYGPQRHLRARFAELPVLTRLFTTLSPQEMTLDPSFTVLADQPLQDFARSSEVVTECHKGVNRDQAPQSLRSDGLLMPLPSANWQDRQGSFTNAGWAEQIGMPALLASYQVQDGRLSQLVDNTEAIDEAASQARKLAPRVGDGAAGCSALPGTGTLGALALFVTLAFRRRR